ncbi:MAG: hypothetical protein AVDCRST_MAG95-1125 [uncultured Adhaeribacter sp.]|uniref:Uncharacterized protein n=1 Tax=uncultured Adhaeribacter sp. TaxID=448109 RepID=A0A6J4HVL2_9BACT|nr:MAG: hypothetical protein AVDCRST_MAG95-1125 [uncultured Adhaeribacter sp.]
MSGNGTKYQMIFLAFLLRKKPQVFVLSLTKTTESSIHYRLWQKK